LCRLAEDGRPRKKQGHLNIKDDEQKGHNVEPQVELDKTRSNRRFTAFVDLEFFSVGHPGADEPAEDQVGRQEDAANGDE